MNQVERDGGHVRVGDQGAAALHVGPLCDDAGIRVCGGIDLATRLQWDEALNQTVVENRDVRMDLSELAFIDVAGADLLVAASHRLAPHRILLCRPPRLLRLMLDAFWPELPTIKVEAA